MTAPPPAAPASDLDAELRRPFEGQLHKFTNVVKGWQYRWFVLNPETGQLEYYLPSETTTASHAEASSSSAASASSSSASGAHHSAFGRKCRGWQHLSGCAVLPSDEDSQTFSVHFASGDVFKLRAAHVKERQVWVDRLRAVAQRHEQAHSQLLREHGHLVKAPPTPPGSRSHIGQNGEPASDALQHLSLSVLDAFGSVHDILHQTELKNEELGRAIESSQRPLDEDLLILKATSHAALWSMEQALTILQDYRELKQGPLVPRPGSSASHKKQHASPKKSASSFFSSSPSKASLKSGASANLHAVDKTSAVSSSTGSLPSELKADS